jgi:hypothetical protein
MNPQPKFITVELTHNRQIVFVMAENGAEYCWFMLPSLHIIGVMSIEGVRSYIASEIDMIHMEVKM